MALSTTTKHAVCGATTNATTTKRGVAWCHPPPLSQRSGTRQTTTNSQRRRNGVIAHSDNPVRTALSGLASGIYKATASFQQVDSSLPPLWQGLMKLDLSAVQAALRQGADPNETNVQGETPLLYIAREGHYKYPPAEIPALLIQSGANLEAKDSNGRTALQVALLSGWQNIAELLIKNNAQTGSVPEIKAAITCPDCKRIVSTYNL